MELCEAIERRRSVRQFKPDPVPEAALGEILRLAQQGPSAGGLRSYKIVESALPLTPYNAPLCLVFCALPERAATRYGDRGRDLYAVQDATIAAAYAQLAAVDLGLASVWVGAFREGKVAQALGLGQDERPVAIIALGYEVD